MALNQAGKITESEYLAAKILAEATLNKDKQLIIELLNFGTDIDGGFSGLPPLCFAVQENDLDLVQFLLSLGASPNVEMNGNRVIVFALENKNEDLVEALLKAGADPNKHNSEAAKRILMVGEYVKWTLLMDRVSKDNISFIKLLVEYGADINAVTFEPGWNALLEAVKNQRLDIVKFLLSAGADPHYKNKNGVNARHLARISGNSDLISIVQDYSDTQ